MSTVIVPKILIDAMRDIKNRFGISSNVVYDIRFAKWYLLTTEKVIIWEAQITDYSSIIVKEYSSNICPGDVISIPILKIKGVVIQTEKNLFRIMHQENGVNRFITVEKQKCVFERRNYIVNDFVF